MSERPAQPRECPDSEHDWIRVGSGSLLTRCVGFRFCEFCDREEWDNGIVRPGWRFSHV